MPPAANINCTKPNGEQHCRITLGFPPIDLITSSLDYHIVGPEVMEWGTSKTSPVTNTVRLSDGDVDGDFLGLMELLVRNVDHSVGFVNTDIPLCTAAEWDPATDLDPLKVTSCISDYVSCIFGVESIRSLNRWGYPERSLEKVQIFERSQFAPFIKMMQANAANGNTAVARMTLTTIDSPWNGIPAGHTLDFALFYPSSSPDFISALPADTRAELDKGEIGVFAKFPYYATLLQNPVVFNNEVFSALVSGGEVNLNGGGLTNLKPEQVNLLAGLTSWAIQRNANLIRDMFD